MSIQQAQFGITRAHNPADADLALRLGIALAAKHRLAWRVVRVGARNGVVRLEGVVPSFYDRQLILAVAHHVAGVLRVEDELAIAEPASREKQPESQTAPVPANHGGTGMKPAPPENQFQHLPELSPSLEEILADRARRAAKAS